MMITAYTCGVHAHYSSSVQARSLSSFRSLLLSTLNQKYHMMNTNNVSGNVATTKIHHFPLTENFASPLLKKFIPKMAYIETLRFLQKVLDGIALTETNVPGRNTMVRAAIVFMEELSFFVSVAMFFDSCAIRALTLLSLCEARLNSYGDRPCY
jgi:hypothetical protein